MIKTTSAVATTVLGEAKILLLLALSALVLGEPAAAWAAAAEPRCSMNPAAAGACWRGCTVWRGH